MSSSSNNADLFNRLQLFRARSEDLEDEDGQRKRIDPSQSRVKRCLFGRGNTEENIKFAKRELEKALEDSKKRWNFDFANERPLDGRFVWQTPPYPKILISKNEASNAATNNSEIAENSENVIPTEKKSVNSQLSNTLLKSSQNPSEINTHTSSSDDQNDQDTKSQFGGKIQMTTAPTASSTSSTSSSSSSSEIPGPGSPSQRSSSRQSSISHIFRQRKRSKSKVKVQERKTEKEINPESTTSGITQPPESISGPAGASSASD